MSLTGLTLVHLVVVFSSGEIYMHELTSLGRGER